MCNLSPIQTTQYFIFGHNQKIMRFCLDKILMCRRYQIYQITCFFLINHRVTSTTSLCNCLLSVSTGEKLNILDFLEWCCEVSQSWYYLLCAITQYTKRNNWILSPDKHLLLTNPNLKSNSGRGKKSCNLTGALVCEPDRVIVVSSCIKFMLYVSSCCQSIAC